MSFGPREMLILLLIFVVLFGARKLPDLARSLGRSARILKAETKGLNDDDGDDTSGSTANQPADQQQSAAQQPGPQQSGGYPAQSPGGQQQYHNQQPYAGPQQGYPELPAGARIVDGSGEPVHRQQGS